MYVTNIQHFCVDDGPGIRTTIFLSGCNLRCKWCHNPENFEMVMKRDVLCEDGTVVEVQNSQNLSINSILDKVKKDKSFYENSSGGITISGGEPALQVNEVHDLLIECKRNGISTAIETALNYDYEIIQMIDSYVDLFIVDCKAVSDDVHIKYTGASNRKILDNIMRMSKEKKKMWIRIPVVPNVNITFEEMENIADFLSTIHSECIEMVPYHKMGEYKYQKWGMEYELHHIEPPKIEFMKTCFEILSSKCSNVINIR